MADHRQADKKPHHTLRAEGQTGVGLQLRFSLLVVALMLSMTAIISIAIVEMVRYSINHQARASCSQVAALLAKGATDALAQEDCTTLQWLADEFCDGDPIIFVQFNSTEGEFLAGSTAHPDAHYDPALFKDEDLVGNPVFVDSASGGPAHFRVTFPISASQAANMSTPPLLGYVHLGINVEQTMNDLGAFVDLVSGILITILAGTVPLAFLVAKFAVDPIKEVSAAVRRFAHGDFSARTAVRRKDEIGELATTFNEMADELHRKHRQVNLLNAELERRVEDRTRQLNELAVREPLTGLYNRRHLKEVMERRFSEALRYGGDLSCLMIDLDNFKSFNDQYGHHLGDELLIAMSTTIASQLRAADLAARFGGDEFILLLPHTSGERAQVLAERIADKFTAELREHFPHIRLSLSDGVASLADCGAKTPNELLQVADRAMYRAKHQGKNRIVMATAAV